MFLGVNQGYVSDEHDGFNHAGVQLDGVVNLRDDLELNAYAAFLEPLDRKSGESLRDLFWAGAAITWHF